MERSYDLLLKFRWVLIPIIFGLTLFFGYQIKNLKINPDLITYLPKTDPAVKLAEYIGDEFGGNFLAITAIDTDDVFQKETIDKINEITSKLKLLDGVDYVLSLTDIIDIKKSEDGN